MVIAEVESVFTDSFRSSCGHCHCNLLYSFSLLLCIFSSMNCLSIVFAHLSFGCFFLLICRNFLYITDTTSMCYMLLVLSPRVPCVLFLRVSCSPMSQSFPCGFWVLVTFWDTSSDTITKLTLKGLDSYCFRNHVFFFFFKLLSCPDAIY